MSKAALKSQLFEQQSGGCTYCGCAMTRRKEFGAEHRQATFDHIVPVSFGGLDGPINLTLCCLHCNMQKRSHTPASLRRMADIVDRLMFERGLV